MYHTFCLLQDVRTKSINWSGTKREGLYYIDDVTPGRVLHTYSATTEEIKKIILWHNWLGHASFSYLKIIVPYLFNRSAIRLLNL